MRESALIPEYSIRQCDTFADFTQCIDLQREVWNFADIDITPLRALIITLNSGGFTLGAFDGPKLLGFAHTLAAIDSESEPYFYSHMLAVKPDLQNSGIGMHLKFAQREFALRRNIPLMVWTFDPLQSRNAYLNIIKLGGVVRTYKPNYYGNFSSSTLHQGLDTDRLLVEWWLDDPRVAQIAESGAPAPSRSETIEAEVEVPFDLDRLKAQDLDLAREWQRKIRDSFSHHLSRGLYCAGFSRGTDSVPSKYLFYKDPSPSVRKL